MIPAADLATLYAAADGFTVACTFGAETTQVHFRQGSAEVLGGERLTRGYEMRYRASTLAGLTRDSAVVIGGITYRVNAVPETLPSGDERIARLTKA